jgi:hypothetical protein
MLFQVTPVIPYLKIYAETPKFEVTPEKQVSAEEIRLMSLPGYANCSTAGYFSALAIRCCRQHFVPLTNELANLIG